MEVFEIIYVNRDVDDIKPLNNIEFMTNEILAFDPEFNEDNKITNMRFSNLNFIHFYGKNKQYIEREEILNHDSFLYQGKTIEIFKETDPRLQKFLHTLFVYRQPIESINELS